MKGSWQYPDGAFCDDYSASYLLKHCLSSVFDVRQISLIVAVKDLCITIGNKYNYYVWLTTNQKFAR